jgi:hypothetical protein
MLGLLDKILDFIEKRIPWLLIGIQLGKSKEYELMRENVKLKLKLRNLEDEASIKDHNRNLTPDQIRAELISRRDKKKPRR